MTRFLRPLLAIVGVFGILTLLAIEASDARPRGGSGSRGSRTYTPPPSTNTAPTTAQPIQRSATPSTASPAAARAATPAAAAGAKPGFFQRPGFMGGLMAGMLGAGLLGLLFGQGLFGNMAGLASILGLLIQVALIGGVAYLIVRWWRSRSQPQQPAFAGMPAGAAPHHAYEPPAPAPQPEAPKPLHASNLNSGYGGGYQAQGGYGSQGGGQQQPGQPVDEIGVKPEDYETFERLLGEIQTSYSKEDVNGLRARVTPEMMTYLSEELSENASRGVTAQLSNVKLLQGDLAEAWAEGNVEYATVAMRYELIDTLVDRNTRQVKEGDPNQPTEAVELWTFVRSRGTGTWMLSAIQQVEDEE
jgi:predicted lipid-binding transport protein (Tim44 family)